MGCEFVGLHSGILDVLGVRLRFPRSPSSSRLKLRQFQKYKLNSMDKTALRNTVKTKLSALNQAEFTALNLALLDNLENFMSSETIKDFNPRNILVWLPAFPGEIDLTPFIDKYINSYSIFSPIMNADNTMDFYKLFPDYKKTLTLSKYKIPEPLKSQKYLNDGTATLILVPGLAFDKNANRLGRGLGCYDKFLNNLKGNLKTIGLCFDFQIIESVPIEENDRRVDMLLSEKNSACI